MRMTLATVLLILTTLFPLQKTLHAQPSQLHINDDKGIEKEISALMNDLELSNDQKMVLGMLILKYSMEFNYKDFNEGSKAKKYTIIKSKLKELDNDLKGVLDKDQYKTYKKRKKKIRKELMSRGS